MSRAHTITAEVYVDLDDFSDDELIAEIKTRRLSARDAEELRRVAIAAVGDAIEADIDRATYELTHGRRREALVWLERALPREWIGELIR